MVSQYKKNHVNQHCTMQNVALEVNIAKNSP